MLSTRHAHVARLALAATLTIAGCSGGSTPAPPAQTVTVTVAPPSVEVRPSERTAFSAVVSGTAATAVVWSVAESGGGTIDASGAYQAPTTLGTFHVAAQAAGAQGTAAVTVTNTPTIAVRISPKVASIGTKDVVVFTATVTGALNPAVTWAVVESACGTITAAGVYTAPGASAACHVTATSVEDTRRSDTATVSVSATANLFLGGYFPIGVFMQNADAFQTWHSRGANMLMGEPNWTPTGMTHDDFIRQWDQAAAALGMRTIRRPLSSPSADIGNTTLLAWAQDDEPDAAGAGINNLSSFVANYNLWKSIDPSRPVYLNFAGPDVMTAVGGLTDPPPSWCTAPAYNCSTVANHVSYINQALDWVSNDLYPFTGWLPDESRRGDVSYVSDPIDRLRSWTNKPEFCFIETSNQYFVSTGIGITPGGLRAEIWIAIVHGARGYVFFPQVVAVVGGTASTDGTPADVAAEMTVQNGIVAQLATTLQGPINPSTLSATVPAPMQAGWRDTAGAAYFFVVNPQNATVSNAHIALTGVAAATSATVFNESRSVTLTSGSLTDTFGPYAVHIYVVPK